MSYISIKDRRRKIKKEQAYELEKDTMETLTLLEKLYEENKNDEAHIELEKFFNRIKPQMDEYEREKNYKEQRKRKEEVFIPWEKGDFFYEDDVITMSRNNESEHDKYIELTKIYKSWDDSFLKPEVIENEIWKDFIQDSTMAVSIYDKQAREFIGYCSIKDLSEPEWEIAIELFPEWCNKGYGYKAIKALTETIYKVTKNRFFRIRIDADNIPSQKLFKKLGAYPNGISEFDLHGEELVQFRKENMSIIDDHIIEVSKEFCLEPEDIVGYVLEYRIDMEVGR